MREIALEEEEESSGQCVGRYSHETFTFMRVLCDGQNFYILTMSQENESESPMGIPPYTLTR